MKTSLPFPARRDALAHGLRVVALLAGAGALPAFAQQGAPGLARGFDAKTLGELARALGGAAPAESREVRLEAPDVAENGAEVPLTIASTAPGLRRLLVFVEKNPSPLAAAFEIGDGLEPAIDLRVKMAQSSNVYAVALLADNRVLFARRDVRVTVGGCAA